MKRLYPEIEHETWEEQKKAGRYNPALVAKIGKIRLILECGSSDYTYFWKDKTNYYVLSLNYRLGYVGLTEYNKKGEQTIGGDIFLQTDYELEEILGKNWEDKSPAWIKRVLINYLPY